MPIYEFVCRGCGHSFEAIRPIGDSAEDLECPACGASAPEKQLSSFAAGTGEAGPGRATRSSCGVGFG